MTAVILILAIIAAVCFFMSMLKVKTAVDLTATGLFLLTIAYIISIT